VTADAVATRAGRSWTTVLDGTRLRQLRRAHGLSQEQLADRARISLATVGRLERQSQASCRGRTLARLAAALDEQPAAISPPSPAGGTQAPPPP
jgi:transcriptional regulator with XRE-family HTH domain